jgi:hypothetical protein
MNIDLGDKRGGTRMLTFLTNENPKEVASQFCQCMKLGPKTENQLIKMIEDKIKTFEEYNKIELKSNE